MAKVQYSVGLFAFLKFNKTLAIPALQAGLEGAEMPIIEVLIHNFTVA